MPLVKKFFYFFKLKQNKIPTKITKACGGTILNYVSGSIASVSKYVSETGCSSSNGGYSRYFTRPSYQTGIQTNAYRGVPDLSANGDVDANSGYRVCFTESGAFTCYVVGGKFEIKKIIKNFHKLT